MKRTALKIMAVMSVVLFAAGCGYKLTARIKPYKPPPPYPKVAAQLATEFASRLPEIYMVLSGPGETYKPYPVNEWAEKALKKYAQEVSSEGPRCTVSMTILTVRTTFETLGRYEGPPSAVLVPARYGLDDLRSLDEIDPRLPQQVEKSVSMGVSATFDKPGEKLRTATFEVQASNIFIRDDDMANSPWAFDYTELFRKGIDKAISKVDSLVRGRDTL